MSAREPITNELLINAIRSSGAGARGFADFARSLAYRCESDCRGVGAVLPGEGNDF